MITEYEFYKRHGKVKVNGQVIEFESYEAYLDYIG